MAHQASVQVVGTKLMVNKHLGVYFSYDHRSAKILFLIEAEKQFIWTNRCVFNTQSTPPRLSGTAHIFLEIVNCKKSLWGLGRLTEAGFSQWLLKKDYPHFSLVQQGPKFSLGFTKHRHIFLPLRLWSPAYQSLQNPGEPPRAFSSCILFLEHLFPKTCNYNFFYLPLWDGNTFKSFLAVSQTRNIFLKDLGTIPLKCNQGIKDRIALPPNPFWWVGT